MSIRLMTVVLAAVFLFIVALFLRVIQMYVMSMVLLAVPVVSYAVGRASLHHLSYTRRHPPSVFPGDRLTVDIDVENHSRWPKLFLRVRDRLPEWLVPAGDSEIYDIYLLSRGKRSTRYEVEAAKRGCYRIGPLQVEAIDPLGMFSFSYRIESSSEVLIYPEILNLSDVRLAGGSPFGSREVDAEGHPGDGLDFHGVREYRAGDELRRVHWKTTARTGDLSVIEFDESRSTEIILALETKEGTERGEGKETTLEYAAVMAASLARYILYNGDPVRLLGDKLLPAACVADNGQDHLYSILEALARMEAVSPCSLGTVLLEAAPTIEPHSTVVVLTPQVDNSLFEAFHSLSHMGARLALLWFDGDSFEETEGPGGSPEEEWVNYLKVRDVTVYRICKGDSLTEAMREVWNAMV
ncbi:MAG: DUF58 domain-containing protein [Armatimonadetes bacterium]|nr:DUF58 domain-containing protein [Armatimonadota bacterium]